MNTLNALTPHAAALPPREERLRQVVAQLQGVFVEQLFKAMRETVPTDGLTSGGAGEQMFAGMMDQHLALAVPAHWPQTLGDALVRALRAGADDLGGADRAAPATGGTR